MDPKEVKTRVQRQTQSLLDRVRKPHLAAESFNDSPSPAFPDLPSAQSAPGVLTAGVARDARDIMAGRWKAFCHIPFQVDLPPRWHKDYSVGHDLATSKPASTLNYRRLPNGADIKWIWELSRWNQLVRLAQAAYLLNDPRAGQTCLDWLRNWIDENPPFTGWNWPSALESGIRLIQFTWIDALLASSQSLPEPSLLRGLRRSLLPPHVRATWRQRSFGSSANNHLLGELTGLIVVLVRWPGLAQWCAPLEHLQELWEAEVLAQFAPDGGNREQALNYHLFSWEFCWQGRAALLAANRKLSAPVEERIRAAIDFFVTVQVPSERWDYGDSDDAFVTPFFADEEHATTEWFRWFEEPESSPAIAFWWKNPPEPLPEPPCMSLDADWLIFRDSGIAICWTQDWTLRWDLSPLGYLSMAAHGHLDALHLTLWHKGLAFVIDPGTGAYHADKRLRNYLSSWAAHNGPRVPAVDFPKRLGPFLWSEHHSIPSVKVLPDSTVGGELRLPSGRLERRIRPWGNQEGWQIDDNFEPAPSQTSTEFSVCWQFAPGVELTQTGERTFRLTRGDVTLDVGVDAAWWKVEPFSPKEHRVDHPYTGDLRGVCSPFFRKISFGPQLLLTARGFSPSFFRTTFLARSPA
jgi:hypothetical protein